MTIEVFYSEIHGDIADARNRFMSDAIISRFLLKFPSDPSMESLRVAVASQDNATAFRAVHTLKSVAANLSFTELHANASALTEQMRSLTLPPDPALLAKVEESYELVVEKIGEYTRNQ